MSPTFRILTETMSASDVAVSDIEGDNLLHRITKVHCGVILKPFTLEEYVYEPTQIEDYLGCLSRQATVVGHNFRGFDLLALAKLYGYRHPGFCFDTLILSRLINPERLHHSLGAWGQQLKCFKGDYSEAFKARMKAEGIKYTEGMEWREFSKAMFDYCIQDVKVNAILFLHMVIRLQWWDWFGTTKAECERCMKAIREGDVRRM